LVKCPMCKTEVNLKPIKEWNIVPKGKRVGPKLLVKLYEHCGRKFRTASKVE